MRRPSQGAAQSNGSFKGKGEAMTKDEKSLIEYALGAPDFNTVKLLLVDILCGCTGADDYADIRKTRKWQNLRRKYKAVEP